jgi:hypothetical protein
LSEKLGEELVGLLSWIDFLSAFELNEIIVALEGENSYGEK